MTLLQHLERDGFAGPLPLYSAAECPGLLDRLTRDTRRGKGSWAKSLAVHGQSFHEIATDPRLLAPLREALGEDIILWGASLIVKQGNDVHPFHTDVESRNPAGGFVSVWMGLSNTSRESGLKFVPGSHRYGMTIQQANHEAGVDRNASTDDTALAAARRFDTDAEIVQPQIALGEAMLFDGRVWHGSHNMAGATRTALLLQYARADRQVFRPGGFNYPFEDRPDPRPPVILVSGQAQMGVNHIAPPPVRVVPNAAFPMLAPPERTIEPFASLPHLRGQTPIVNSMEAHSSILAPGATPHSLHHHKDEEIIIIVDGTAELHTAEDGDGRGLRRTTMGPGGFAYYPAWQWHTLVNTGDRPVLYTMFKWFNSAERSPLRNDVLTFVETRELLAATASDHFNRGNVLDVSSRWLSRLTAHVSVMAPGRGYDAHADSYDVGIVLIEGAVRTLGGVVAAPALIYHPAFAPHGLSAVGDVPARYVVFEFHGDTQRARPTGKAKPKAKPKTMMGKLADLPRRALRKARKIVQRAR